MGTSSRTSNFILSTGNSQTLSSVAEGSSGLKDDSSSDSDFKAEVEEEHDGVLNPDSSVQRGASSTGSQKRTTEKKRKATVAKLGRKSTPVASISEKFHTLESLKKRRVELQERLPLTPKSKGKHKQHLTEPDQPQVHWDFLLAEMKWMSADFVREREFKRKTARKSSRSVAQHISRMRSKASRDKKLAEAERRALAKTVARQVKQFWGKIDKIVSFKQRAALEEIRREAMDKHLESLVVQVWLNPSVALCCYGFLYVLSPDVVLSFYTTR